MIFCRGHLLKHWASTQATHSLSSGEAEAKALTKGAVEGLYMKHLLEQQGYIVDLLLRSDASAAIGAANRLGAGKRMKHLELQDLWIQQLVKSKLITIRKVSTRENPADILTKNVPRHWLDKVCEMRNLRFPGEDDYESVGGSASLMSKEKEEDDDAELDDWNNNFQNAMQKWWQHVQYDSTS